MTGVVESTPSKDVGPVASIRVWADMVKLAHSVFALPFALIATFLAGRDLADRNGPYLGQIGLIVLCMVTARSVAMTFNRIVDAEIDARNPRTASRPIPVGRLSRAAAYGMLILSAVTFAFGCMGFFLFYANTWPILLSGPVLVILCGYSFTKRFTRWSHFYLGCAIALAPPAAWLAVSPATLGLPAVLLSLIVAFWIAGFDIIYACQDIDVDRRDGLHSLPSRMGPARALWIARSAHLVVVGGLIALGVVARFGWIYAIGAGAAMILLIVENALVRPGDYRRVNLAFFTINGVISLVLAAAAITEILIH